MSFSNIMDSNSYRAGGTEDPLIASRERVLGAVDPLDQHEHKRDDHGEPQRHP